MKKVWGLETAGGKDSPAVHCFLACTFQLMRLRYGAVPDSFLRSPLRLLDEQFSRWEWGR
jgi:hypothetical protein